MLRLCLFAGLVLALTAISGASVLREKRDACEEINAGFNTCNIQAYEEYKKAFEAGDDGRPDWMARKSCNYMTAAVEECGNKLIGDCNTEEDATNMKDEQLRVIIGQLETSIEEWDSEKCPPVQSYVNRMKRDEDGAEEDSVAEEVEAEDGEAAEGEEADSETADAEEEDDETVDAETEDVEEAAAEVKDGADAGDDGVDEDTGDETESDGGVDAENEEDAGDVVEGEVGEDTETEEGEDVGGDPEVDTAGDDDAGSDEKGDGDKVEKKEEEEEEDDSSAASISASLSLVVAFYLAL